MMIADPISLSFDTFSERIQREFIVDSGIAAELFEAAVRVTPDVVLSAGGEVATPIHDALNWRYTRFGYSAKETLYGAFLKHEDASIWQVKLSAPRFDKSKGRAVKYETPVGNGSRGYLPPVPPAIRQKISERYAVNVPYHGSFWQWLEEHPEIPMLWTEGGKKALCLLSNGFVAVALYGVTGGYRKQVDGTRVLTPDVQRFCQPERVHYLAFDQDEKESTKRKVNVSLYRFGSLLEASQGKVFLTLWEGQAGKGVDDLVVNSGILAFTKAYTESFSFIHWRIDQRLNKKLTYPAQVRFQTADLSETDIHSLPDSGIIAISSAKGTGKTKFIRTLTSDRDKVLSATHRIALGRNLCARLELNWKGDLDKVGGSFITGSGYTLKVGFCVDSLLAIDPEKFRDCDLILDEVVQVVRHLITSSTCAREGKRPALLSRFRELMQAANRVVVADADLDNATLQYLQELRGSYEPVFLIRNHYQSEGYPVTFVEASEQSAVIAHLLETVCALPERKVVFAATDSKGISKVISQMLQHEFPEKRILLINSETSSGELEREFIKSPDRALEAGEYDIIICSPSLATGVSIETQGIVHAVYGVFTGVSATDSDMAQALSRVREPVERIVWCSRIGSNYSRISRSQNFLELKNHLQQTTSATVRLVRDSLKEEITRGVETYDWQSNPHLNLYCRLSSEQNFSMAHLRDALLVRLKAEGNRVTILKEESNPAIRALLVTVRQEQKEQDAQTLVKAADLTYSDILLLEQKEVITPEEQQAIAKYYLKDFYGLDTLTVEDVHWDHNGRRRSEILALEVQFQPELARDRTVRGLEKQAAWNQGVCPWDISNQELKRALRERLGLTELISKLSQGWEWTRYDLEPYAERARQLAEQIRVGLHFSIHSRVSDVQIIHQLLSQLGIRVEQAAWSRSVPGHEGEKLRVYQLDVEHWRKVKAVLDLRRSKREAFESQSPATGSPCINTITYREGDPAVHAQVELLVEALQYGREAVQSVWDGIAEVLKPVIVASLPKTMRQMLQ